MATRGPTVGPPPPDSLNTALSRNIEALKRRHDVEAQAASFHERLAADHLGVESPAREEIEELKRDIAPEAVLDALKEPRE